jgi:hypothetical protein
MRSIRENAEKILEETMNYANGQIKTKFIGKDADRFELFTLRTFIEHEAKANPDFYKWLFDDYDITFFGTSLTKEQIEEYKTWLHDL